MRSSWMLLSLLACTGGDKDTVTDSDSAVDEVAPDCEDDEACSSTEICSSAGECVDGDLNEALEDAEPLLWDDSTAAYINTEDDSDYYVITSTGDEYLRLYTVLYDADTDTVVTLRGPDQKVLLSGAEYPNGAELNNKDAVLYAYLPEAGDYLIEVEHNRATGLGWYGPYAYDLHIETWTHHTEEPDSSEDPSGTTTITADSYQPWGVVLGETGDVDYLQVTFPYDEGLLYITGILDLGGSEADPSVTLKDEAGRVLMDGSGVGPRASLMYPLMTSGTYTLELTDADGSGSSDHWYYVFLRSYDEDSVYPSEVEPNGEVAEASAIDWYNATTSSDEPYFVGYGQGFANIDGAATEDVDLFEVDARSGGNLVVCLNSSVWGSSIAPDLAVVDETGAIVASDSGSAVTSPTAVLENIALDAGTYYLRVTAPVDGTEDDPRAWYRFRAVFSETFTFGSYGCP